MKLAVLGHVEHVSLGYAQRLPGRGEIVHLDEPVVIAGGGGGVTFAQLAKSSAETHFFTALGNDAAAREVEERLAALGGRVHAARRAEPQTRDVVMLTPDGERSIVVLGQPLHPRADDHALPFDELGTCDAAYFTAQDPALLVQARRARLLVVTARRKRALDASGVAAEVVVGSRHDPAESSYLADYAVPPRILVMTAGPEGGTIETASGSESFRAPPTPAGVRSSYGCGDSFTGALVYFLAQGMPTREACERAGEYGAAVLLSADTLRGQRRLP